MNRAIDIVWRLPSLLLIGMVRVYQWTLSPLLGPHCRFEPSCSHYFIAAIRKYGVLIGSWRGVRRICRCHPFHKLCGRYFRQHLVDVYASQVVGQPVSKQPFRMVR